MRAALQLILPMLIAHLASTVLTLSAQPPQGRGGQGSELIHQGAQLDLEGQGTSRDFSQREL